MRFVTCLNYDKLGEMIDLGGLSDNLLFDLSSNKVDELKSILEDLNGNINSVNIGLFIPNSYGPLSSIWNQIAKILPIKGGDAILEFNLNADECIFCNFNSFLNCVYSNVEDFNSYIDFNTSNDFTLAICDDIPNKSFNSAYIVGSNWNNKPLNSSITDSLVNSLSELNSSIVWRS